MRADTFLSMYRVLEGTLEKKYAGAVKRGSSLVMDYIADPESEPVRLRLNTCREIRNLLTHSSDADGSALVEPSQAVLDSLYEIIKYVETPQPALMYATRGDQMLRASLNDRALDVMRRMEKRGYSHVPVISGGRMAGVFSVISVFSFGLTGKDLTADTRISEFGDLLSMDGHRSGRFLVMAKDASYMDVRKEFERLSGPNDRLNAVFITATGEITGELLGILTPWDVLGEKPS